MKGAFGRKNRGRCIVIRLGSGVENRKSIPDDHHFQPHAEALEDFVEKHTLSQVPCFAGAHSTFLHPPAAMEPEESRECISTTDEFASGPFCILISDLGLWKSSRYSSWTNQHRELRSCPTGNLGFLASKSVKVPVMNIPSNGNFVGTILPI